MSKKDAKIVQFQTAKKLFELNLKKTAIASFLKVSTATVSRWLKYNSYEEYCEKSSLKSKKSSKPIIESYNYLIDRIDRLEDQINALSYLIK